MSWGTCYSGSNNIHFDFPPIMADGRNFAKWQPGAVKNADSIIKSNQLEACDESCYCPALRTGEQISNTPFLYKSCMDKSQPYGYETSDLKNVYLSSYQLQARMVAPAITQEQLLQQKYPNPN